jgi:hypothetical protein
VICWGVRDAEDDGRKSRRLDKVCWLQVMIVRTFHISDSRFGLPRKQR